MPNVQQVILGQTNSGVQGVVTAWSCGQSMIMRQS
jgi:hypothetical protein